MYIYLLTLWVLQLATALTPPSADPFYLEPANITAYAPGEAIRTRQVPPYLQPYVAAGPPISVRGVHQYLYRTTDTHGNAIAAAATLLIPHNADPTKLLAYETFYDANSEDCSPSYTLRYGSQLNTDGRDILPNMTQPMDLAFLSASLTQGWYIITSDYESPTAQFAIGRLSGHATLDSVRVALTHGPSHNLSSSARYAMWGYSGGALAVSWAASLQPTYAPDLTFSGAAIGGLLPNLTSAIETINMGPFSGAAFVIFIGLAKAYPSFATWLDSALKGDLKSLFFGERGSCVLGEFSGGMGRDFWGFFVNGEGVVRESVPMGVLRGEELRGAGIPEMDLYVYKGVLDEISPVGDTDELVSGYCEQGSGRVRYERILGAEHVTGAVLGSVGAVEWLKRVLAGDGDGDGEGEGKSGVCIKSVHTAWELDVESRVY
ncbi:LIP-domain-containing protein [Aspergillus ellipticus CBS 707.79]|uniref:LIP-domain-containing protein n=1 Tax=Aspergillus ellipticus CBS 707.79 TaxID=1448320 RepID=A0A319D311_9EURO|nr:LIP-domain-containing protein [Aspergillus ellipticus CBS 707.79]